MRFTRKPMRSKALLAIAFAGGLINSQQPALSEEVHDLSDSVIQQIANNTQSTPETRAFYLLSLARIYATAGGSTTATEAQFRNAMNQSSDLSRTRNWQKILVTFADQASLLAKSAKSASKAGTEINSSAKSIPGQELILADTAIQGALAQLEKTTDKFAKLNMYFIASCLYQRLGNFDGVQKCNKVLQKAFLASEGHSSVDNEQIKATSSVLNSMAYGIIPIIIQDHQLLGPQPVTAFTENDFKASEKLKLRAVAVADQLDAKDHVRRKAHRDLALWYTDLGKMEMAEKEKQVLSKLVGCTADEILYPQVEMCGHLVWWERPVRGIGIDADCGMG